MVTRRHICDRVRPEEERGRAAKQETPELEEPELEAAGQEKAELEEPEQETPELLRAAGKPDWPN